MGPVDPGNHRPGIDFSCADHLRDPYSTYRFMREHYPVCQVEPTGFWAVVRYDDVKRVLKRNDLFSSAGCKKIFEPSWIRPECRREVLIFKDPPEHTKLRAIIKKPFAHHIVKSIVPFMRQSAAEQSVKLAAGKVDFISSFAFPYVANMIIEFVGVRSGQSIEALKHWAEQLATLGPIRPADDAVAVLEEAILNQQRVFLDIINERRKYPKNDMVTQLVNAEIDGAKIPDKILVDTIDVVVFSGFHTSIQTLARIVLWLSRHPDFIRRLKAAPALIPAFVEEMLRVNSNGHATLRVATQDVTLSGITIPEGAVVLAMFGAANRDGSHFPNPDEVDLSRENTREHLSFGFGPHTCIGTSIVRLQLKVALEALLYRYAGIACDETGIEPLNNVVTFGFKRLPVTFY